MSAVPLFTGLAICLAASQVAAQDVADDGPALAPVQEEPITPEPTSNTPGTTPPLPNVGVRVDGGNGFALSADGRSRLHLGVDAGAGFDTNPYSVPTEGSGFAGDVVGRIRPKARIDYPGSTLAFAGNAMVDYGFFPGAINEATQSFLLYQSLVSADLEVNRGGLFQVALGDSFSWNSDPGFIVIGTLFNRIHNDLRAGVGVSPGGGALDLRLGYNFGFTKYFDVDGTQELIQAGALDNMTHTLSLRADYKFLPKTGFFTLLSGGYNYYYASNINPPSFPVSVLVGLQGQLLAKLAGLVSVGYSNPLVVDDGGVVTASIIGLVGQAEIQWLPTPTTRLGGGFRRSFQPTPLYQYLGQNRFYGSLSQLLGGRFLLNLDAGYSILEYGEEVIEITDRTDDRLDGHLDANVSLAYFFTDWLSLGISNNTDWRLTNASDLSTSTDLSFIRNQTLVLASVLY